MRYFVCYLIEGEAGAYHKNLVDDIATRFNIPNLNTHIPPHLTLKAPFETDRKADEIEQVVRTTALLRAASLITASGFSHFNNTVMYLNIHAPKETKDTILSLTSALKKIEWLPFEKYDHDITLHASLARLNWQGKYREKFDDIWKYVQSLQEPAFDLPFDHFAIMRQRGGKPWETLAQFYFPK